MQIDPGELRSCLGRFATGVTVVSCDTDGRPHGVTVNAYTAVSLDPPLVLVSLGRQTRAARYLAGRPFTVNVLRSSQHDVALHFAGTLASHAAFRWEPGVDGLAPRLAGALAYLDCTPWRDYDGGDHVLYLGAVQRLEQHDGEPLVFYASKFRHVGAALERSPWLESLDCPWSASWLPALSSTA